MAEIGPVDWRRILMLATVAFASGGAARSVEGTSPLDAYAEAAATTILAEQKCQGVRLQAGRLTTLRLATKVTPAQEAVLQEKLRSRAGELRQRLAADGAAAWCDAALDAFGPQGTVARGVLTR
jgi:hypothetical protein